MDVRTTTRLALLGTALALGACTAEDDDLDVEFRDAVGDGRLAIHEGTTTANPDCQLWDLLDGATGGVQNGPAANGQLGQIIMFESPTELIGTNGSVCTIVSHCRGAVLYDNEGTALLSTKGRKIYEGDRRELSGGEIHDALLYKVTKDHIRDGQHPSTILMTATESLQHASAWRLLTIGALAEGYCGGNGLP